VGLKAAACLQNKTHVHGLIDQGVSLNILNYIKRMEFKEWCMLRFMHADVRFTYQAA